jgi:hypothetical protein
MNQNEIGPSPNQPDPAAVSTKNSRLRQIFNPIIQGAVTKVHERYPAVTPDDITNFGKYMIIGANVMVGLFPDNPVVTAGSVVGYTVGGMADGGDGFLADTISQETGAPKTTEGMLHDNIADRLGEMVTFAHLSLLARRRGNKYAAALYALATMTSSLSAVVRAEYESHGYVGEEGGFGTHADRLIAGGVGLGLNRRPVVANAVSALVVVSNLATAKDRLDILRHGASASRYKGRNDDPAFKEAARIRQRRVLLPMAAAGVITGAALLSTIPNSPKNLS